MGTTSFFVLLFIHLSGLILAFGAVLVTDLYGLLWVFDRLRFPHLVRVAAINERFIWTGWLVMVAAGIPLILLKGAVDNLMIIKLFFVALIGINGIFLHLTHKQISGCEEGDILPNIVVFRLGLALFVSQLGWWGAVVIGFLHRHVQSVIQWPDAPWLMIGLIVASLAVIWGVGEAFLKESGEMVEA